MTVIDYSSNGFIYLIRAENGLYKIGKTKDLEKRIKPFHVDFPMKWEMVYSFQSPDYGLAESFLHIRFSEKRDVGEWFRLSNEDIIFIMSLRDGEFPSYPNDYDLYNAKRTARERAKRNLRKRVAALLEVGKDDVLETKVG